MVGSPEGGWLVEVKILTAIVLCLILIGFGVVFEIRALNLQLDSYRTRLAKKTVECEQKDARIEQLEANTK